MNHLTEKQSAGRTIALGIQHAFAMFCATILVPVLTGLDPAVALFAAGVGTLLFHCVTGFKMPVFLGSSFAFIASLVKVIGTDTTPGILGEGSTPADNIPYAMGGIVIAGVIYMLLALLVKLFGKKFIDKMFPPVVRGVGIVIIGLNLAPTAINNITSAAPAGTSPALSWIIAVIVLMTAVIISCYGKGMFRLTSIVSSLAVGYIISIILAKTNLFGASYLMNFDIIAQKSWFALPNFTLPKFSWAAISLISPIALVTAVEHVGDVYANSAVCGKDFTQDPGFHRTLLGDGIATTVAGLLGGPANTTYSENTAVLAITKNYNPASLRVAAVFAMVMAFFGKFIGLVQTVPGPVLGGACILLYGMIASVGLRTLVENKVDFTENRNLSIAAVMLVVALGGATINIGANVTLTGISLGILTGIIMNLILPAKKTEIRVEEIENKDGSSMK